LTEQVETNSDDHALDAWRKEFSVFDEKSRLERLERFEFTLSAIRRRSSKQALPLHLL